MMPALSELRAFVPSGDGSFLFVANGSKDRNQALRFTPGSTGEPPWCSTTSTRPTGSPTRSMSSSGSTIAAGCGSAANEARSQRATFTAPASQTTSTTTRCTYETSKAPSGDTVKVVHGHTTGLDHTAGLCLLPGSTSGSATLLVASRVGRQIGGQAAGTSTSVQ